MDSGSGHRISATTRKIRSRTRRHRRQRSCPDIWELENGDVAVIGTDMRKAYATRLPAGVTIDDHESLVVIPRRMLITAKPDIPDA